MKEVRVYVNDQYLWSLKVDQAEALTDVAKRAADSMRLTPKSVVTGPGLVNLVTHD